MTEAGPIIGITVDPRHSTDPRTGGMIYRLNANYAQRVAAAGGIPILVTPDTDPVVVSEIIDGWLIPGGLDLDAANYGQDNHEKNELQVPARFAMEQKLFAAFPAAAPILGICYGCQVLNVLRGGTLEQHTPDRVGGEQHGSGELQEAEVAPDSLFGTIVGEPHVRGKSYHHQSVDVPGAELRVVATHPDGTIEAIEATDRPWLVAVQWHPERTPEDEATQRLFAAFVDAARAYRANRRSA